MSYDLKLIRSSDPQGPGEEECGGSTSTTTQLKWSCQKQTNQISFLIDATSSPVDIRHPTDLSPLNDGKEVTEILIDTMHAQ
ncbi:hypothetical protein [Synechococcus sp. NB0720_010]|uniref:hypothetical protein n=1 Tax=Synechococcus sp. NB0720_010 TaxID=2907159 RepID=UPI001FF92F5B|nr:hypothetical protein [Synechococcus sp. NB0720_010]UPH89135.1 hypothetical protein LY254_07380 [Synechococcus sp. NB0720_010]